MLGTQGTSNCVSAQHIQTVGYSYFSFCWWCYSLVLVKLIGVNKGRHVTLKYFSILIKVSRKHRLFIELI